MISGKSFWMCTMQSPKFPPFFSLGKKKKNHIFTLYCWPMLYWVVRHDLQSDQIMGIALGRRSSGLALFGSSCGLTRFNPGLVHWLLNYVYHDLDPSDLFQ